MEEGRRDRLEVGIWADLEKGDEDSSLYEYFVLRGEARLS